MVFLNCNFLLALRTRLFVISQWYRSTNHLWHGSLYMTAPVHCYSTNAFWQSILFVSIGLFNNSETNIVEAIVSLGFLQISRYFWQICCGCALSKPIVVAISRTPTYPSIYKHPTLVILKNFLHLSIRPFPKKKLPISPLISSSAAISYCFTTTFKKRAGFYCIV